MILRKGNGNLEPPGVLIPLYSRPGQAWDTVLSGRVAYPSIPMIAIINPENGPGQGPDPEFVSGVARLETAGIIIAGYVSTGYGEQTVGTIRESIDNYLRWYKVTGIFFDEIPWSSGSEAYYRTLGTYAKSAGIEFRIGNPGGPVSGNYLEMMDISVISEGVPEAGSSVSLGSGFDHYPGIVAGIFYGVKEIDQPYIDNLVQRLGYLFVTDQNPPDPYCVLPRYFMDFVRMVAKAR